MLNYQPAWTEHCTGVDSRRGATLILVAILLPAMLAVAAFAINAVYIEVSRTQLQVATDLATRASGRTLAVTGNREAARQAAARLLRANPCMNQTLTLAGTDVHFGVSTRDSENERYTFGVGDNPNAVRLRTFGSEDLPLLLPTGDQMLTFRPIKNAISTQVEMDIAIVLDRSGSMAYAVDETSGSPPVASDPTWSAGDPAPPNARWRNTVAAVNEFIRLMNESSHDERISLCTYSDDTTTDVKLTNQYVDLVTAMDRHTVSFGDGATNIGDGILEGAASLSDKSRARRWASRVLIVMTDGIHNTGSDPESAAELANAHDVMVYTVTFSDEADVARMQRVAAAGGGEHYHADSAIELSQVFRAIAHRLPTLITY